MLQSKERAVAFMLLGTVLCIAGVMDMWITNSVLHLSICTSCFLHGAIWALYALENWTLAADLQAKTEPLETLMHRNTTQEQLIHKLTRENQRLEHEKLELKAERPPVRPVVPQVTHAAR